ncbi:MAG TPA: diguanylate cyclase, partial [Planctomycetaceae bacterium]|nr:diguanylate cyclase [Planctomycetaceae bacterium]
MCGVAGFLCTSARKSDEELREQAAAMTAPMAPRGPDAEGVWTDAAAGIALGHRRLAILDLSPAGHQPMTSACGRYVLVYNGEIYNHLDLRPELESQGCRFRGHSDTETLLEAIARWGLEPALRRSIGMFAFALWDRKERRLTLVRDRLGIKPLYYGWCGDTFFFASELKPLRAHPDFQADIDREALSLLLRHNYVPAPHSIYRGIRKLPPGTQLTVRPDDRGRLSEPSSYWTLEEAVRRGRENPFRGSARDAIDELESLLDHAGSAPPRGALLVFDLDQFKFINDRDGHDAGD